MSLEKAFLADICAHPEEDAPRLIYADWLQDNGDPDRAEFIRAQCELARKRLPGGARRRKELTRRVSELLQVHGGRWTKAHGEWCSCHLENWERGFPEKAHAATSLSAFGQELPVLLESVPVRSVFLTLRGIAAGEGAALASCPGLARLRGLTLFGNLHGASAEDVRQRVAAELRVLLHSSYLENLQEFECIQLRLSEDALAPLLKAGKLRSLELYANGLDDGTTRAICRSPVAASLNALLLGENCTWRTAQWIARTPALAGLGTLDLDQTEIGDAGARHLAGAAHLSGLRVLRLYSCGIGDAGATALANSPYFGKLRELNLSRNAVLYAGARSLAASTTLPRGMELDLWDNEVEDYTAEIRQALRERFRKVNYARSC